MNNVIIVRLARNIPCVCVGPFSLYSITTTQKKSENTVLSVICEKGTVLWYAILNVWNKYIMRTLLQNCTFGILHMQKRESGWLAAG